MSDAVLTNAERGVLPNFQILSGAGEATLCFGGFIIAGRHGLGLTELSVEDTDEAHTDMQLIAQALNVAMADHPELLDGIASTFTDLRLGNHGE